MRRVIVKSLLVLLVVLVILLIICYLLTNNPVKIIEKKVEFGLPESSQIVEFSYNRFNGFFEAKILLNQSDIDMLKNSLLSYFHNVTIDQAERIPYNYRPKWWDLDYKSITTAFGGSEMGPGLFITKNSVKKAAVIVKQTDGKYFLYIDFAISPAAVIF